MKLKGTIRRSDLEGGQWVMQTEGGDQYQLTGEISTAKDGMRAEVEGKVDKQAMGFGMVGAQLRSREADRAVKGLAIIDQAASTGALREIYAKMLERPMPPTYRPAHGGPPGIITATASIPS